MPNAETPKLRINPSLAFFLAAALAFLAAGCITQGATSALDQEAQDIDRLLMCPVCPAETINQSQVPLAKQMRAIVREKLAAGEQRQAILDFFVERYGESVLAAPSPSGFNLLVWILPGVGMVLAVLAVAAIIRNMRSGLVAREGSSSADIPVDAAQDKLAPYLVQVDEDLRRLMRQGKD